MSATTDGLEDEADEDLMTMMSWEEDPKIRQAACAEIYRRHAPFLYSRCQRAFLDNGMNTQDVEDLVSETFVRARERAGTFVTADQGDDNYKRHRVRAWLFVIAQRLALDFFRGRHSRPRLFLDPDNWDRVPLGIAASPSQQTLLVRQVLAEVLDEREREILLVTMQYYDPEKVHQRLPDDVVADLAKRYGTTSENLRKIRMRALAKIREYIDTALPDSMTAG